MKELRIRSLRGMTLFVAVALASLTVPHISGPPGALAQTPAPIGTPVAICGPVASFTPASSTTAGSITFSNASTTQSFALPAGTSLTGNPTIATGTNLCLIGTVNSAGQLTSVTLTPNSTTNVNLCGPVTAYTPATLSSLGSLTLGTQVVTLGLGTTFTGATLATGSNVCIAATVNSLGIVNGGTVAPNTAGTTGNTLVTICGPVSSYTAPTSTAAGTITISNVSINATYTLPAGSTTSGTLAIAAGGNVCLVGVSNGAGQLSSATFTTNTPISVFLCGKVSSYTPASPLAFGTLTVGSASIPLALGTTFTGAVTVGTNQCFTLTLDSLGQAVSGSISTPLAAVLYVPRPVLAHRNIEIPL